MGVRRNFSRVGQRPNFADPFQVADDAMQMDVHKALHPFFTTKKITHDAATVTKMRFVGRNNQVYYDNLH